jgi:hypothetical protein
MRAQQQEQAQRQGRQAADQIRQEFKCFYEIAQFPHAVDLLRDGGDEEDFHDKHGIRRNVEQHRAGQRREGESGDAR